MCCESRKIAKKKKLRRASSHVSLPENNNDHSSPERRTGWLAAALAALRVHIHHFFFFLQAARVNGKTSPAYQLKSFSPRDRCRWIPTIFLFPFFPLSTLRACLSPSAFGGRSSVGRAAQASPLPRWQVQNEKTLSTVTHRVSWPRVNRLSYRRAAWAPERKWPQRRPTVRRVEAAAASPLVCSAGWSGRSRVGELAHFGPFKEPSSSPSSGVELRILAVLCYRAGFCSAITATWPWQLYRWKIGGRRWGVSRERMAESNKCKSPAAPTRPLLWGASSNRIVRMHRHK